MKTCLSFLPGYLSIRSMTGAFILVTVLVLIAGCGNGAETSDDPSMAGPAGDNDLRVLIRSGDPAPDGRGLVAGVTPPLLNNNGQVLFAIEIDDPRADVYDVAIIAVDSAGTLRQLIRTGQSLPDGERLGWMMHPDVLILNDAGQAAFWLTVDADWNDRNAIYRIEADGSFVPVYNVRDHELTHLGRPLLNGKGQIAFEAWAEGDHGLPSIKHVYRVDPDGTRVRLFGSGDATPDGDYRLSTALQLGSSLNDSGWLTFYAAPNPVQAGGSPTNAFYRSDGSGLVELARRGQPALQIDEEFEGLSHSRYSTLDDFNRAVFYGRTRMLRPPYSTGVLVMHTDAGLVELARQGAGTPHGKTFETVGGLRVSINQKGQAAFLATMHDVGRGVFRAEPDGKIALVAEPGQSLPDGSRLAGSFAVPTINAGGKVAFLASNEANQHGLFVAEPGRALRTVVMRGQEVAGRVVLDVEMATNEPGRSGFSDLGQVAFKLRLDDDGDHQEAIIVAGPDSY